MRFLILLILFTAILLPSMGFALDEKGGPALVSPDGEARIIFSDKGTDLHEAFKIEDRHGKALFDSALDPAFKDVSPFWPELVLWSPDSNAVALTAGYHLKPLYLLIRTGEEFTHVPVPPIESGWDNFKMVPTSWHKGNVLEAHVTGPHAGKTGNYFFEGTVRFAITLNPPACRKIYEKIDIRK